MTLASLQQARKLPRRTSRRNTILRRIRMVSVWQINRLPGLFAVKMVRQQISLTNRLAHQSMTNSSRTRKLKSGQLLIRGLDIDKSIPVSVTKLTLGLRVPPVVYISSCTRLPTSDTILHHSYFPGCSYPAILHIIRHLVLPTPQYSIQSSTGPYLHSTKGK